MRRLLAAVAVAAVGGSALVLSGALRAQASSPLGARTLAFICGDVVCVWDGAQPSPRAITRSAGGGVDSWPTWSPDGRRIAFLHSGPRNGGAVRDDLVVVDVDGSHRRQLVSGLRYPAFSRAFAWSPDGRRIAVSRESDPDDILDYPDLYLVDVATRRARRLTRSPLLDAHPTWAGSRLLYARVYDELGGGVGRPPDDIRAIDVAARRDRLVRHMPGPILELDASPDGRRVLVADGNARGPGLWVVTVAGGRRSKVAGAAVWSPGSRLIGLGGTGFDARGRRVGRRPSLLPCASPSWSPDGGVVACTVDHGDDEQERSLGSDIVLVDPATGARTALTSTAAASEGVWRPRVGCAGPPIDAPRGCRLTS